MPTPSKTPSSLARLCAGTHVPLQEGRAATEPVYAWVQRECREGSLRAAIEQFIARQPEMLDPAFLLVETIAPGLLTCGLPTRVSDHESKSTFPLEVRFTLDPTTGATVRLESV